MIEMVRKKGKTEEISTEIKLPKWLDDLITKKWFLYLMVATMVVLFVGFSLPANTRADLVNSIFAKTATEGTGPPTEVKTPEVQPAENAVNTVATGAAVTDWQAKLEADKKDPVLAERIKRYITPRGEILIPLNAIPKEFKLYHQELNVYIVGLAMDSKGGMTGIIENRGSNTVKISKETGFLWVNSEYKTLGGSFANVNGRYPGAENLYIKSGEKKSFIVQKPPYSASEIAEMTFISPVVVVETKDILYETH